MTCTMCDTRWDDIESFITDEELDVCGYQARFDVPSDGLILVTHMAEQCGTTLGVRVAEIRPLYDGPMYPERKTGSDECPGLCLLEGRLEDCTVECSMAWVRHVIQAMRRHEMP